MNAKLSDAMQKMVKNTKVAMDGWKGKVQPQDTEVMLYGNMVEDDFNELLKMGYEPGDVLDFIKDMEARRLRNG